MTHQVIRPELIFLDVETLNRTAIIQLLVDQAYELGLVEDKARFIEVVEEREKEVSTAIGYDIAIPHGKSDVVKSPFIAFVRTTESFNWKDENDETVSLIFLIGVPEAEQGTLHLKFISGVSRRLLDEDFRKDLSSCQSTEAALDLLTSIQI